MSNESRKGSAPRAQEMFCIHSYAGELGPRCGWRGAVGETLRDTRTGVHCCPRCGRASLLEIPPERAESR